MGTIPVHVGREGLADIDQQRETIMRETFTPPDGDLTGSPIDVVEL